MHYHPICHYLRGQRLYYILITVETTAADASKFLATALNEVGLSPSACAYWLFGDTDIIIRVWAGESTVIDLKKKIKDKINHLEHPIRCLLVSSMETWYQREIEKKPGWHKSLIPESCVKILKDEPPEDLRYSCGLHDQRSVMRYFIFIKEPSTKNKHLFKELSSMAKSGNDTLFSADSRISLYSVYSRGFNGVLLKGETDNFSETAQKLVDFASMQKNLGRETTTYICSTNLKKEENNLTQKLTVLNFEVARRRTIENLLLSEECNASTLNVDAESLKQERGDTSDLFIKGILEQLPHIFHYHEEWWPYIKDLRYLYKWVIFQDNEQLMAFLARHYALCENDLRLLLQVTWNKQQYQKKISQDQDADRKLRNFLLKNVFDDYLLAHDGPVRTSVLDELAPENPTHTLKQLSNAMKKAMRVMDASFPDEIIRGIRRIVFPEQGKKAGPKDGGLLVGDQKVDGNGEQNMTMGSMASYLDEIVTKHELEESERKTLADFAGRLRACGIQRNRVVHGAIPNFFETTPDGNEYQWQKPVFTFISMRIMFPHAIRILQEKWRVQ